MKTAQEILKPLHRYNYSNSSHHYIDYFDALKIIEQVQNEAYNQGLEDAKTRLWAIDRNSHMERVHLETIKKAIDKLKK